MAQITTEELYTIKLMKANVEKAQTKLDLAASNMNMELMNFKYFLLSLYRKYNLADTDVISEEDGIINKKDEKNV